MQHQGGYNINKITFAVVFGIAIVGVVAWADTKTTYRYGKTTVRDVQGRIQGTATTDRYGKTTYRDAQGRIQGTKK